MRGRYTDEHPDVQNLRSRIARLEASIKEDTLREPSDPGTPMSTVSGELATADAEIARLEARRQDIEGRMGGLRYGRRHASNGAGVDDPHSRLREAQGELRGAAR